MFGDPRFFSLLVLNFHPKMLWLCRGGLRVPGRLGGWILCAILVEGETGNVGGDPVRSLEDHPRYRKCLVTTIYKPFRPFVKGNNPS